MISETAHIFFPKKLINRQGFLLGYNITGFLISVIHVEEKQKNVQTMKIKIKLFVFIVRKH